MKSELHQIHAELLSQHEELRELVARCDQLADDLDANEIEPAELLAEVVRLRVAFEIHNRFEERVLRPLMPSEASVLLHVEEHQGMHHKLGETPVTAELRATIARIRFHLEMEERYFASALRGANVA